MTITGQSGAGMLHMFNAPAPVRTWLVQLLPGMCPPGESRVKRFRSVDAFDGYVRQVRASGYPVSFTSPFTAIVEARP